MGDTGSLSVGGALGAVSVITKHELVLAIIGGLFVLETASVIVQVASFKMTGRRVFRMAPLHHHFEKKGWKEPTIVIRFWILAVIWLSLPVFEVIEKTTNAAVAIAPMINMLVTMMLSIRHHSP